MMEKGEWGAGDDKTMFEKLLTTLPKHEFEVDWDQLVPGRTADQVGGGRVCWWSARTSVSWHITALTHGMTSVLLHMHSWLYLNQCQCTTVLFVLCHCSKCWDKFKLD